MKKHIAHKDENETLCGRFSTTNTFWMDSIFWAKKDFKIKSHQWCKICLRLFNANFAGKKKLR